MTRSLGLVKRLFVAGLVAMVAGGSYETGRQVVDRNSEAIARGVEAAKKWLNGAIRRDPVANGDQPVSGDAAAPQNGTADVGD